MLTTLVISIFTTSFGSLAQSASPQLNAPHAKISGEAVQQMFDIVMRGSSVDLGQRQSCALQLMSAASLSDSQFTSLLETENKGIRDPDQTVRAYIAKCLAATRPDKLETLAKTFLDSKTPSYVTESVAVALEQIAASSPEACATVSSTYAQLLKANPANENQRKSAKKLLEERGAVKWGPRGRGNGFVPDKTLRASIEWAMQHHENKDVRAAAFRVNERIKEVVRASDIGAKP